MQINEKTDKTYIKILILGDSGVGKTSTITRFFDKTYINKYVATIGVDFFVKEFKYNNKKVLMQVWDTAGQERFSSLSRSYFRGTDGCILMFDLTNQRSFDNIENWRKKFIAQCFSEYGYDPKVILIGNKVELINQRQVSDIDIKKWLNDNRSTVYLETSAAVNLNVDIIFNTILEKCMVDKLDFSEGYSSSDSIVNSREIFLNSEFQQHNNVNKSNCC
jgi:Ras-related protein Rab-7A